ncbi:prolyl oligopeptidase family serine peptidase [Sulfurimonas sp.]|uniref:prolyl oligopeptidase family serine peptidase n=1 Tax=Sulfurimonas sp. TaxID=2022749 RepID=UPI003D13C66A
MIFSGCSKLDFFISANISPLKQNHVTLSDGYEATYYKVQKGKSDTTIIFVGGSGHTSLNYYLEWYFETLENVTIYALQKRYVGHLETGEDKPSKEFLQQNYYQQLLKDQQEFVNFLIKSKKLSTKKLVVFGFSEGGDIAAKLASKTPQITHLIMVGSGGMVGLDAFKIWGKQHDIDFDKVYEQVKKDPQNIQKQAYGETYKYWNSVLDVDPMKSLKILEIPIFVATGEKDEMAPVESVYFMQDEFVKLAKANLTVKVYPDCNHMLEDSSGKSFRGEMLQLASRWWNK